MQRDWGSRGGREEEGRDRERKKGERERERQEGREREVSIDARESGADPENSHGRWLTGLLPIVNILVQGGWLVNNGGHLLYYVA